MEIVITYPHRVNRVKCNTNHDWSMFKDGETLKDGHDFQIQECNFKYNADLISSQYLAVPFRDYYEIYPKATS